MLAEFDEGKRSCRKRLDGHNRRRRKPQSQTIHSGNLFSSYPGNGEKNLLLSFFDDPFTQIWTKISNSQDKASPCTPKFSPLQDRTPPVSGMALRHRSSQDHILDLKKRDGFLSPALEHWRAPNVTLSPPPSQPIPKGK